MQSLTGETEQVDEGVSGKNCSEDLTSQEDIDACNASKFVLDWDVLLHHVPWKGLTFKDVAQDYISYVNSKYGLYTVVFDGYNSRSTKDHEDQRRAAQVPRVQMFKYFCDQWHKCISYKRRFSF